LRRVMRMVLYSSNARKWRRSMAQPGYRFIDAARAAILPLPLRERKGPTPQGVGR
jgi:hypothetical protein